MTTRYVISTIMGDGQPPDGYYPAIDDITDPQTGMRAFNSFRQIGIDPNTGDPVETWTMTHSSGSDWTLATQSVDVDVLPDCNLDQKINTIPLSERIAMGAMFTARGIDVSAINDNDSFRTLINHLGKHNEPAFDADKFLVE